MRKKQFLFLAFFILFFITSCATTQQVERRDVRASVRGVWHRVREGQTLWRIAKTYRVSLEEIKEANDIEDVVHIAKGTWIWIPGADKVLYVQGSVDKSVDDTTKIGLIWPVRGDVVRSFGKLKNDFSFGIDIQAPDNDDVVASLGGVVVVAGVVRGYGETIIIEHEGNFCSLYSKNIKSLVKEGQTVKKNTVIAKMDSNRNSADEEMHYELFYRGKPVNPLYYLP